MEHLILLPGAIGSSAQLGPLGDLLLTNHKIHFFDFSGHGGKPFPQAGLSMPGFAAELLNFMEEKGINQANLFGYSMGGYVSLYLARHSPHRVNKVITLGTKFHWNESIAEKESGMLDPVTISEKLPGFAEELSKRHAPQDWKELLRETARMLRELGRDNPLKPVDYICIQQPVLLLLGDRDKMVSLEETSEVLLNLPNGRLNVLPETPHPIEKVDLLRLVKEIDAFLL
ncbi:MAG: alpha/beta fold hydrolase [Chitinophagaceae bacterium]|nr:alpha/beta fold hydrolase [Chitinophagaceae bacterium]MBL0056072.1 alpha/beta fold hydrolase [Chitinophagaceae bacterium]